MLRQKVAVIWRKVSLSYDLLKRHCYTNYPHMYMKSFQHHVTPEQCNQKLVTSLDPRSHDCGYMSEQERPIYLKENQKDINDLNDLRICCSFYCNLPMIKSGSTECPPILPSLKIHVNLIQPGECALDCIPRHYKREIPWAQYIMSILLTRSAE